jgi:hypothetical protein
VAESSSSIWLNCECNAVSVAFSFSVSADMMGVPYGQAAMGGQFDYTALGRSNDSWRHGLFRNSLIGMLLDVRSLRARSVCRGGDGTRRVPATWELPNKPQTRRFLCRRAYFL